MTPADDPRTPPPVPPPLDYSGGKPAPTPADRQKEETGWVILYAGIIGGMVVIAAAAVAAVVLMVRR